VSGAVLQAGRARFVLGIALASAGIFVPALVAAWSGNSLTVTPNPLVLDPGTATTTWSGAIRLQSDRHLAVTLLPQALIRSAADPDASVGPAPVRTFGGRCEALAGCIDAAAVKVEPASLTLDPNIPAEAVVTVTGPLPAGVYDGALDVVSVEVAEASSPPGSNPIPELSQIGLQVVARVSPLLTLPAGGTLIARRVRLDGTFDEFLASLFLTEAEQSDQLIIPVANDSRDPMTVTAGFAALGQASGGPFPSGAISFSSDLTPAASCAPDSKLSLPAQQAPALKACLSMATINPDRYLGNVYLTGTAGPPAQAIPLDLTIKEGPSGPFALILAGIVLSWFAKWLIERAFPAAALLDNLRKLLRRIDALPTGDQAPLRALAQVVRSQIDADDQEAAQAGLEAATSAVEVTEGLVDFEAKHGGAFAAQRENIRAQLREGLIDEAVAALRALRQLAVTPPAAAEGVQPGPSRGLPRRARASGTAGYALLVGIAVIVALLALATLPLPAVVLLVAAMLVLLLAIAGRRQIGSYLRGHWVNGAAALRPIVRVAIGLGLAIVGFETLYVANGAQLIATTLDPIVVFTFWGLGSDVASRTIINFAKPG
jgi:hypothetical protein